MKHIPPKELGNYIGRVVQVDQRPAIPFDLQWTLKSVSKGGVVLETTNKAVLECTDPRRRIKELWTGNTRVYLAEKEDEEDAVYG